MSGVATDTAVSAWPGAVSVEVCGETLWLLPERAVFWPRERALLVADLHIGKAEAFQRSGLAVPGAVGQSDFDRLRQLLSLAVSAVGSCRLVILGDLVHARVGITDELTSRWRALLASFDGLEAVLIPGNHDRVGAGLLTAWKLARWADPTILGPFTLTHDPVVRAGAFVIGGHIHPAVSLGPSRRYRVPAFWLSPHRMVLPAFSDFTAGGTHGLEPDARLFAVAPGHVSEVTP
jgi:uncharacterized protein